MLLHSHEFTNRATKKLRLLPTSGKSIREMSKSASSLEPSPTPTPAQRHVQDDLWTEDEVATLKAAWFSGKGRAEIGAALPGKSYGAISMKLHRLGFPSRKKKRRSAEEQMADIAALLADDPTQAGYRFLDHNFTDHEVLEAFQPAPPPELVERPCKNCRRMTLFESRFQRWCETCRRQMNQIA